jgi:hypothetical protein
MDKQGLWRGDSDFEISEVNYKGYLKKQVQKWEWGSANIQLLIENRKSNATGVPAILRRVCGCFAVLTSTSPFGKGGLRGISLGLKSLLAPLC